MFPKGTTIRAGPGLERGGHLPLYTMANFYTGHPEIPAAEENTSSEKFERDRVQAETRLGEYWRSLQSRVTNLHEVSQPNFFRRIFSRMPHKKRKFYEILHIGGICH